jgi:ATP diphosphatase
LTEKDDHPPEPDQRPGRNDHDALEPLERLLAVMAALRHPETGCPWDLRQTHATIAPYTIEEAYEVGESIARADWDGLKDELGDLLFNVVYHARLAEEAGRFAFQDVAEAAAAKMIRRHPHVFATGHDELADAARSDLAAAWDAIKSREKTGRQPGPNASGVAAASALDGIPSGLPALLRAQKLTSRARKAGFDWNDLGNLLAKVDEELAELKQELARLGTGVGIAGAAQGPQRERIAEEFGDLMFVFVNLAAKLGLDAETALMRANVKFESRFRFMELELLRRGLDFRTASDADMRSAWDAAKRASLS